MDIGEEGEDVFGFGEESGGAGEVVGEGDFIELLGGEGGGDHW